MSTKASEDANPNSTEASAEKEGGLFPAILAGAGILAVVAVLALWPSDEDAKSGASDAAGGPGNGAAAGAGPDGVGGRGGVQAREADEARMAGRKTGKVRPGILPDKVGMNPGLPPKEEPPTFESREDEIAWYERKLEDAKQMAESRKKFAERLPDMRERIENSDNPNAQLEAFESRKKIVEENYEKAQARVEEIEAKLAQLRQ